MIERLIRRIHPEGIVKHPLRRNFQKRFCRLFLRGKGEHKAHLFLSFGR